MASPRGARLAPKVREMKLDDYIQVAGLQARNGLPARAQEDWTALWRENPTYRGLASLWPLGWVLETSGGQVVGSVANIPLSYRLDAKALLAATASSWVVDSQYRAYSMQLFHAFVRQGGVDLFICTSVSPSAEPVLNALHFRRVPAGNWSEVSFWITNYRGFVESALRSKSIPLAALLSHPAAAVLYCRDKLRRPRLSVNNAAHDIEMSAGFDSRFDIFWEQLCRQNAGSLLAVRTRETLEWHFRSPLSRKTAWVVTIGRNGRLIAYAIVDRHDNVALGLRRITVLDFQAVSTFAEVLHSLVSWLLIKSRREGIHVLEVSGGWLDLSSRSRVCAPYRRTLPSWTYYYKAASASLSEALRKPAAWAPSPFDGDASL